MPIFHGKIAKPAGETPSDLESQVSQVCTLSRSF